MNATAVRPAPRMTCVKAVVGLPPINGVVRDDRSDLGARVELDAPAGVEGVEVVAGDDDVVSLVEVDAVIPLAVVRPSDVVHVAAGNGDVVLGDEHADEAIRRVRVLAADVVGVAVRHRRALAAGVQLEPGRGAAIADEAVNVEAVDVDVVRPAAQVQPLSVECCPSTLAPQRCSAKNRTCALEVSRRHRHTTCVVEDEQCDDSPSPPF